MYEKDIIKKRAEIVNLTQALEEKKEDLNKTELAGHIARTWHGKIIFARVHLQSATDVQLGYLAKHVALNQFFEAFAHVNGIDLALTKNFINSLNVSNMNFLDKSLAEVLCWWFDTLPDIKSEEKGYSNDQK
jgi:hypothetical protein